MNLWEVNKAQRRRRIVAAARELIATDGVAALSMRRVAQAAQVSVATLYNLVGSREEIVVAMISDALDDVDRALEAVPDQSPLSRARSVITVSVDYFAEDETVYRPVLRTALGVQCGLASFPLIDRCASMQRTALRAAIADGLLTDDVDPDLLGWQILQSYGGAMISWAQGVIDHEGFRAQALYGLYCMLLGVATEPTRTRVLDEIRSLEGELRENLVDAAERFAQAGTLGQRTTGDGS